MRDKSMHAGGERDGNEVPSSFAVHADVASRPLDHPGGIETGPKISQLMVHDISANFRVIVDRTSPDLACPSCLLAPNSDRGRRGQAPCHGCCRRAGDRCERLPSFEVACPRPSPAS
jgi:hypothetical protein